MLKSDQSKFYKKCKDTKGIMIRHKSDWKLNMMNIKNNSYHFSIYLHWEGNKDKANKN
jgi:hypothetical protein